MSSTSDGFGAGAVLIVAILFLMLMGYVIGVAVMSGWVSGDCRDFGKTSIRGQWYECRPVDKK
jgi:hypothetical protein